MQRHTGSITERIDGLFELARRHSATYSSPDAYLDRERYQAEHPTAIVVLKCMDGRINIPVATRTPPGIIHAFRNLGGIFNLGWPHLGDLLMTTVGNMVSAGRRALVLVTYHFSKASADRGCAGFDFNTDDARAHTFGLKAQVEELFGSGHGTVYPIVCGFETDEEAILLHGNKGDWLHMAALRDRDRASLSPRLSQLYPDMPAQMQADLTSMLLGNLDHIAALRGMERKLDSEHREWLICVGRGFDWLHVPNQALIIGPFSPDLAVPIGKAAGIIESNMKAKRVPDDGFLLLSSAPYDEIGVDRARARLKARFMGEFAAEVIRRERPVLAEKMLTRSCTLHWGSRVWEVL